jgi:taurine transport system substrate-binding protein
VITAVASGDVQIGYLGSSPLAAAATRKLPVETFLIATQIGAGEALVARDSIKTRRTWSARKSPCRSCPPATTACWPR